ncbi:MAG: hypothetical protein ACFB4I_12440 [Cyanophyceae cyanobacterium]
MSKLTVVAHIYTFKVETEEAIAPYRLTQRLLPLLGASGRVDELPLLTSLKQGFLASQEIALS